MDYNHIGAETDDMLRSHCNGTTIFTDILCLDKTGQELKENELWSGELSAVIFQVGCYIIRSALRIYKLTYDFNCDNESEVPVSKKEVEAVKETGFGKDFHKTFVRDIYYENADSSLLSLWNGGIRVYHEISAGNGAGSGSKYMRVCRALQSMNPEWCEYIGDIFTMKENDTVLDERASLLVYSHYESSSFGMDVWHKLEPDGNLSEFKCTSF